MCHLFFTTTAVARGRGRVFTAVCLSVFPDDISNTDAARITKHELQMLHLGFSPRHFRACRCFFVQVWVFAIL